MAASTSKVVSPFLARFINRNPVNLDMMRITPVSQGYQFEADKTRRHYYYKVDLVLSRFTRHCSGRVHHHTAPQTSVLTASTREWPLARRLYSCVDRAAAYNVGRVLARRCLQAGIGELLQGCDEQQMQMNQHTQQFYRGLADEGMRVLAGGGPDTLANTAHAHRQPYARPGWCYDDQLEYERARIRRQPVAPLKGREAIKWH